MLSFSDGMCLTLGITSSICEIIYETFCDEASVVLYVISLPIKSPVAIAVF